MTESVITTEYALRVQLEEAYRKLDNIREAHRQFLENLRILEEKHPVARLIRTLDSKVEELIER